MPEKCRLPAEWEPQDATLLTWPHGHGDWTDLDRVESVFLAIADAVCRHQRLLIACADSNHRQHVVQALIDQGSDPRQFHCLIAASNDSWVRDHGPLTVYENGQTILCDFSFNGWGKYPADLDNALTRCLHRQRAFGEATLRSFELVVEGGNLDSDGAGTVLTNRRCLFHENRNPQLTEGEIRDQLCHALAIDRLLEIREGRISGDDTDGHIDMLARFCDPQTIAYSRCDDRDDSDYPSLRAMEAELRALRTATGQPYRLHALPAPGRHYDGEGRRLPASYANFLIINGAVLVPQYDDPADPLALEQLARCFPGRKMIPVDCQALIEQYGSLHCVTMQLPAGALNQEAWLAS